MAQTADGEPPTPDWQDSRTDEQIFAQTLDLARDFYSMLGCTVPKGYRFDKAHHPQEQLCWKMAARAQLELTQTDIHDCYPEDSDPQ